MTILIDRAGRIYKRYLVEALLGILDAALAAGDENVYFLAARQLEIIGPPIEVFVGGSDHAKR